MIVVQQGDAPDGPDDSSGAISPACFLLRFPKHAFTGLARFLTSCEREAALEATLEVFGYGSP